MEKILVAWIGLLGIGYFAANLKRPWMQSARLGLPIAGLVLLWLGRDQSPAFRLVASSLLMLYVIKAASSTLDLRVPSSWRRGLAMFVWPGFDHEHFAERRDPPANTAKRFLTGLIWTYAGGAAILVTALYAPTLGPVTGWFGIAAIIAFVHFGISNVLTSLLRLAGFPVRPLFEDPLKSNSLREFWGARWNIAFVEMDRRLFIRPLTRRIGLRGAVFGVFLISGLLHEMAISYPSGAGYGMPLFYFAIQGLLVLSEKKFRLDGRIWTMFWVLAPLPLLFHGPFRERLIQPLFLFLHGELISHPLTWWFDKGLWVLGVLQICVLMASFQVPSRLKWREELPNLSPFNQKLMWTYGATIVLTITAFGILTLALHGSFLRGEPAALGLAGFITLFWIFRLACDALYFHSEDWPKGEGLQIGHYLLNSLFSALVIGYGALVIWHWVG